MMRSYSILLLLCVASTANAWVSSAWNVNQDFRGSATHRETGSSRKTVILQAVDYNDPVVAEEFAKVQPMQFEEVEAELMEKGIRVNPSMNDMDIKLMLVEMRLMGNKVKAKKRPTSFANKFEEAYWTKPAFTELYDELKARDDHNSMNVIKEFVIQPDVGQMRYGKSYADLLEKCKKALTAPPPVKSPTVTFSGFPANMGEDACRMTLESLGAIASFECSQDDDFPVLKGTVTYEDIESAKSAVAQYDGMDMGMGTKLELRSA